jgi:O-antigen ligase
LSALIVAAMMVGSSVVTLAVSLIALVAAVVSPFAGMIILALTASLPRPLAIPPPGLYFAIGGAILLGVVLRLPIERPRLRVPSLEVLLIGAFFLYVSAHLVAGLLDGASVPRLSEIQSLYLNVATGVLAFIAAGVVLRGKSPYPILAALLLSALLASTIALAQSIDAEALFGQLAGPSAFFGRMTGPFGDPNYFGAYLAAAATLAVACAVVVRSPWMKAANLGIAGFVSLALLLTLSRGGIVALAAGLTTIAFLRSRRTGLATVAGMLLALLIAYPLFAVVRYGTGSDVAGGGLSALLEAEDRVGVWLPAVEVFGSAPLFGVGYGRIVEVASSADSAHNWYFATLAETGIVGFVLWALFIIAVVLVLRRRPQSARTIGYSVLAAWTVSNMFLDVPNTYQGTGPVLIALAAALRAQWTDGRREAAATASHVVPLLARPGPVRQDSQPIQ